MIISLAGLAIGSFIGVLLSGLQFMAIMGDAKRSAFHEIYAVSSLGFATIVFTLAVGFLGVIQQSEKVRLSVQGEKNATDR